MVTEQARCRIPASQTEHWASQCNVSAPHVCREGRIQIFCWWEIEMLYLLFWTRKPEMPNMVLVTGHHLLTPNPGNVRDGQWRPNANVGWALLPLRLLSAQRCVHGRLFLKNAGNSISLLREWASYSQRLGSITGYEHRLFWGVVEKGWHWPPACMRCTPISGCNHVGLCVLNGYQLLNGYPFTNSFLFSL